MSDRPLPPPTDDRPDLPPRTADVAAFRLGDWTIRPALNRITANGRSETLEPRMMHVLVCLAARPGEVLGRRLLLDVVWRDLVVGEEVLTRVVSRLRDLLGDDSRSPRFIETIRGGGYRLIASPEPAASEPPHTPTDDGPRPSGAHAARRVGLFLLAVVVLVAARWLYLPRRGPTADEARSAVLQAEPFTALPGIEGNLDVAPDGATVVFTWDSAPDGRAGLFLMRDDTAAPRRVTATDGYDYSPRFSPDGGDIAFVRAADGRRTLRIVPILGGASRQLVELETPATGLCWAPDGRSLVFTGQDPQDGMYRLRSLDLETLETAPLTFPDPSTHTGDSWPRYSPDGRTIVFARCDHAGLRDLWTAPAAGGGGSRLTHGLRSVDGVTWRRDGSELVVAAAPGGRRQLLRVDPASGEARPLPLVAGGDPLEPVFGAGGRLVFRALDVDNDLLRIDLSGGGGWSAAEPFLPSTRSELGGVWAPDGRRVAILSRRSGVGELWLAERDGGGLRRLSDFGGPSIRQFVWSPDGESLAVTLLEAGASRVELLDVESGRARTLTAPPHHVIACGWAADGQRLALLLDRGDGWALHDLALDGGALTDRGLGLGMHPMVVPTPDGFWFRAPGDGLWRWSCTENEAVRMLAEPEMTGVLAWYPAGEALYHLGRTEDGSRGVFVRRAPDAGDEYLAAAPDNARDLAVAPDGRTILLTAMSRAGSDLMTVDLGD